MLRTKKREHQKKILFSLDIQTCNTNQFWSTIRNLTTKRAPQCSITVDDWYHHFRNLFNCFEDMDQNHTDAIKENFVRDESILELDFEESQQDSEWLDDDISEEEVVTALRNIKNGKAAGPDRVIGEFLKYSMEFCIDYMVKLFNKLFTLGIYPGSWSESIIQPLHKKGDKDNPENYRGISLLNILSKVYSHILNRRLNDWIDEQNILEESQAGFRKHYSTVDHIFTMTALVQKQLLYHRKLYVAFIDFRKAFDSVVRSKLWGVLRKKGLASTSRMYNAITSMYFTVKARVRAGGDVTECFLCPRGVKQGEVCSPVLFSLFIDELAREMNEYGKHGVQLLPDLLEICILMFADDVCLISDSVSGLQNQLNVLLKTAKTLELTVNLEKSNIVVFRNGGYLSSNEKWTYGDVDMKVVNMYKYLGVLFSTKLSFSHALNDMSFRAKKDIVNIFRLFWSLSEKSPAIFFKLLDVQIQPMLMYGAEVWGLATDLTVIERVHLFALKRFLGVSSRTSNDLVYGETGRYPLFVNIYVKVLRYWLKLLEMDPHRIPFKAYKMLVYIHEQNKNNWACSVCFLFYRYGLNHVCDY